MSLRAIVAHTGRQGFRGSAAKRLSCSRKDENNFTARFMGVRTDRRAGRKPSAHDTVAFVRKHPRISGLRAAIEVFDLRFVQLFKIDQHILFLPVFDLAPFFFR